MKYKLSNS